MILSSYTPIEIRKIKKINLKGGTIIDGFPSVGLTNAIASECFVRSLKTELVAVLNSPGFPPLSIIRNSTPNFPARIYTNEDLRLTIFASELSLDQSMYYSISRIVLQWAIENECELIISAAGMPASEEDADQVAEAQVYAVASTSQALNRLANAGVPQLSNGSVTGIAALLLNEGVSMNFDVIVLLVKVLKDSLDFRAAAAVSKTISKLVPGASCDIPSLLKEAELIEKNLKKIRNEQGNPSVRIYG